MFLQNDNNIVFVEMSHSLVTFFLKADLVLVLRSALQLWKKIHFETNSVWTSMVQVHRIKKKSFYIMKSYYVLIAIKSD
jgi:hypothetical protein